MRNILFIAMMCGLPAALQGQASLPLWTQDAVRERSYPAAEWYIGFVSDRLKAGAEAGKALKALERDAQNQLSESIIVTIEGSSQVENTSESYQSGGKRTEQITTGYKQAVKTATTATTVKNEVKSYHDPATGKLYAFAAVRRADLAAFYRKSINVDLNKVETALGVAEQLVAAGKKMSARRKCEEGQKTLASVSFFRDLLTAVNAEADEETLQTERSNELVRSVEQRLIDLEQSTFVYVSCKLEYKGHKDDAFGSDPGIICNIVKQALSENECSVTDNKEEADYELTLAASTTQRSDGSGQFGLISYYANVRGTLYNRLTRKKTVDFTIFNDADCYSAGKSAEDAATKAFKLPALRDKVLGQVLPKIKN
ncbi:MAG: hypothetical protein LBS63_03065 [Prevotellaceae bacterium]|jgi:hypothetical protein|nr:hypothetical protein [Prevotellaceae bacterium]